MKTREQIAIDIINAGTCFDMHCNDCPFDGMDCGWVFCNDYTSSIKELLIKEVIRSGLFTEEDLFLALL